MTNMAGNGAVKVETLVALHSGSLPVIYKDESQPAFDEIFNPFENQGYEYFRNLRDPLLSRVVSYQTIFQITRDSPLMSAESARRVLVSPPEGVRSKVQETLEDFPDLSTVTNDDIEDFALLLSSQERWRIELSASRQ